jgi:hypothetical protein
LKFYGRMPKKRRIKRKHTIISAWRACSQHKNAPLVTRRKCSSTTEYLLSYKTCIRHSVKRCKVQGARRNERGVGSRRRSPQMANQLTDQNDVFCTLFLVLHFTNVKVRIIRRLKHISPLLLLALSQRVALKVRGRHVGFLQQRWT